MLPLTTGRNSIGNKYVTELEVNYCSNFTPIDKKSFQINYIQIISKPNSTGSYSKV